VPHDHRQLRDLLRQDVDYDYVGNIQVANQVAKVDESRIVQKQEARSADAPQLVANGFSTLILVFHPQFQDAFLFREAPDQNRPGVRAVQFELRAGARSTTVFEDAVCDLQGCPERSARVDDAVRLIRKELMPRVLGSPIG